MKTSFETKIHGNNSRSFATQQIFEDYAAQAKLKFESIRRIKEEVIDPNMQFAKNPAGSLVPRTPKDRQKFKAFSGKVSFFEESDHDADDES